MSNTIDQYSPIVPLIVPQTQPVDLERVTAQTIETKIGEAIGSFTVGILGPFFIHFSFIFHFILFPFFLKIETENE